MKKLLILLAAVCLSPCLARAQLGNVVLIHFSGTPTGGCSQNQLAENDTTGAVYNCASGSWAAITGSASSVAFSGVTTGTNASALHMGAGGSLDTAGGGTIAATSLEAKTWEAPGTIGSTTPNTGAFSTVSLTGQLTSTLATGTAPFSVASTTPVANLSIGGNAATATSATNSLGLTFGVTSIPLSATAPTANQCLAADGTAANIIGVTCGSGGGGNVSTSGSPLNHQYAIFSPDSTHITGVTPGTAGLPLVSNGTSADPSAQALPVASLVAPSAAGDTVCGNSTPAWADCVPGVAPRTVSAGPDTIVAGDRLNLIVSTSSTAVAASIASAASLGNNFTTKVCVQGAGTYTITPTTSTINGGSSYAITEGHCVQVISDNTNYSAYATNGVLSTDSTLTTTASAFGTQLALAATSLPFGGGLGTSFQDVTETAAPGNPAAGNDRLYADSTSHTVKCLTSSGGSCLAAGGSTTWDAIGNPAGNLSLTMGADTSTFTYNATTSTANLWTETDTANNTGNGYLHRIGTAAGSAAFGLNLFATGSAAGAFTNAFALNVSNPTAATSSQAQPSPKSEMCGRTWSGAGADTADCFSWQITSTNVTNPAVTLNLVHESGTTGALVVQFPTSSFSLGLGSMVLTGTKIVASTAAGNMTYQGGSGSTAAQGSGTFAGGAVTGGSSAVAAGGALLTGGNDASTSTTSSAGSAEILAGAATGATQGLQGLVSVVPTYVKGATVTQWNVEIISAAKTVTDGGASPGNWACIAEVVNTNTVQCVAQGETFVNASAAVTIGDPVCAGSTGGKVTDSGSSAACANGSQVGIVEATSGTFKLADGTSATATTTLPLILIARD